MFDPSRRPRLHPESNGVVEHFNGTVRDESDNGCGNNYLRAEAIIVMTPAYLADRYSRLIRLAQN
jgi:hypothetical protein